MNAGLYGLVLAGGISKRMGHDKGLMRYHGKAQRYYLADLLKQQCDRVFISCRPDQYKAITDAGYDALPDDGQAKEQYGAILSALTAYPDKAWLVAACDLPLVDRGALAYLIKQRDTAVLATAYESPGDGLPEPLLAIWEPRSRSMLLDKLSQGVTCPRKALIRSTPDIKLVAPQNPLLAMNANTPDAARGARSLIRSQGIVDHVS
jgi:molybdopterin-guanine dinucleotide biosynthesis protein A